MKLIRISMFPMDTSWASGETTNLSRKTILESLYMVMVTSQVCFKVVPQEEETQIRHLNNNQGRKWQAVDMSKAKGVARFLCGGTLISEQHVLTAAHCFLPSNSSTVLKDLQIPIPLPISSKLPSTGCPKKYFDFFIISNSDRIL